MLRLIPTNVAIIACLARRDALDALAPSIGIRARVAPDEAWLLGRLDQRSALLEAANAGLAGRGMVVEQTDGWWAVTSRGDERLEVIRRLMLAPIPAVDRGPVLVQGAIAGVPGKVIYDLDRLLVMVPAPAGHHLMDRLAAVTGDLTVQLESPAPLVIDTPGASC